MSEIIEDGVAPTRDPVARPPAVIPPYDGAWADRFARLMRVVDGVEINERTKGYLEHAALWESSTAALAELLDAVRRASYPRIDLDDDEDRPGELTDADGEIRPDRDRYVEIGVEHAGETGGD